MIENDIENENNILKLMLKNNEMRLNSSERSHLWRRRQSHFLPQGQERLHYVLHVRGRTQASHALSGKFGLQSQWECLRLAGKCRRLSSTHSGPSGLIFSSLKPQRKIRKQLAFEKHFFSNKLRVQNLIILSRIKSNSENKKLKLD